MVRAPCCSKMGLNKGPWTPEEDDLLVKYIGAHGEGCWRGLPKAAGLLRCGKSCRLRWVNYLRPTVKRGNISQDEEDLIIKLHSLLGNRWSLIAARMPGRTDNEIKNYWNTHLSKKLAGKSIKPKTHKRANSDQPKDSKAGHCGRGCEPLNITETVRTINMYDTNSLNESCQSPLAVLGVDYSYQLKIVNMRTPTSCTDNTEDFPKEASSTRSHDHHKKSTKEDSASSESAERSMYSQETMSLNSMTNYHSISSVSSSKFHYLQWLHSDRANSQDYLRPGRTASVIKINNCINRIMDVTPPSSMFCGFSEASSKCNSPSDFFTKASPLTAVSSLDSCIIPHEENDTNILENSSVSLFRQLPSLPGQITTSSIAMPAAKVDEALNNTASFDDSSKIFVIPKHSLSGSKLDQRLVRPLSPSISVTEEEIWKCVDNFATEECLGAFSPPDKPNGWNVPERNTVTSFSDFEEDLASFEWWLLNLVGDGEKGLINSDDLNRVEYHPESMGIFQNLIHDSSFL